MTSREGNIETWRFLLPIVQWPLGKRDSGDSTGVNPLLLTHEPYWKYWWECQKLAVSLWGYVHIRNTSNWRAVRVCVDTKPIRAVLPWTSTGVGLLIWASKSRSLADTRTDVKRHRRRIDRVADTSSQRGRLAVSNLKTEWPPLQYSVGFRCLSARTKPAVWISVLTVALTCP